MTAHRPPDSNTLTTLLAAQRRPFSIITQNQRIKLINAALCEALGYAETDLIGASCCRFATTVNGSECRHQRFFRDLEPYVETDTVLDASGQPHLVRAQGFPVLDAHGTVYLGEMLQLLRGRCDVGNMVGDSPELRELITQLTQAAVTDAAVLLYGETGVGKELAAQFLHQQSSRAGAPFVVVDCTVLNEELFESELFGHVKGAFTGAVNHRVGLFELAHTGTLFFDEIGELPLSQQPKLLRALETGTYRPVGATATRQVNVRVISATHRDLTAMVRHGHFRQDLFYRLAVLPLRIPPLRERRDDLAALSDYLLRDTTTADGQPYYLHPAALDKLHSYSFPGNVRELRNLLHLGAALSSSGVIEADAIHLPTLMAQVARAPLPPPAAVSAYDLGCSELDTAFLRHLSPVEAAEARQILALLQRHHGNRREVAVSMTMSERTLYRKLRRYGLNRARSLEGSGNGDDAS
ncbi:sigma 54-interacting transcriptional regulator [Rhodopseudomonas palustris]|uniref:Sigma 54-interacting transcriptional regulator n=1 Tax=Thiospirillum jenense TaxID=1653858 RepID=A0A839HGQ2_9GAMM|nr:sigma 54-interacting transcriptional regulator [Thiospirillum jenense]MBB1091994.1 sigma 54-interacting transcriptional regulator [Rhodopseudomonas palustris]MBB1126288.1 sigma 54-interacting transcriptional regulator [Thiospirillum jenense]